MTGSDPRPPEDPREEPSQDDQPDDRLDARQRAVRDLLAATRHEGPTPPAVVERLDARLAELAAERDADRARVSTPVADLAARRRRRLGTALVAAAAVVVAGVGLGQVLGDLTSGLSGGDSASESSDFAEDQGADGGGAESGDGSEADPGEPQTAAPERRTPGALSDAALLPGLQDPGLRAALADLADAPGVAAPADDGASTCVPGGTGPGRVVEVTFDGDAGLAVFRTPTDGARDVDLYLCGTADPVRSVRLRTR